MGRAGSSYRLNEGRMIDGGPNDGGLNARLSCAHIALRCGLVQGHWSGSGASCDCLFQPISDFGRYGAESGARHRGSGVIAASVFVFVDA